MINLLKRMVPVKVKTKLLTALSILLTLMVAIPSYFSYRNALSNTEQRLEQELTVLLTEVLDKITRQKSEQLRLLAFTVAGMPSIQDNLQFQSRDDLLTVAEPLFDDLKTKTALDVFHFHTPPAISFLRLQDPDKYGDDLSESRRAVLEVNTNQVDVAGVEVGDTGLTVRAVVPVKYLNRKHAGSVEFGASIDDELFQSIKEELNLDISLIVPDKDGFRYQAKTHELTIPKAKYPFLKKMMDNEGVEVTRVTKNGKELLTAYTTVRDYSGKGVGVLAIPKDIGPLIADARKSALISVSLGFLSLIAVQFFVYFLFTRLVDRPIKQFTTLLERASLGDLSQEVTKLIAPSVEESGSEKTDVFQGKRTNEFFELSHYMHAFIKNVRALVSDVNVNSDNLNRSAGDLVEIAGTIDTGSSESANRAENVAKSAEEMSSNMSNVAAATEQAAANVQEMTRATEEISSTVGEIQSSTATAREITGEAVNQAVDITAKVDELGAAALDIGKVTETIAEISGQTNLLALNATIEAARAGEAGKGFGVVANEIKDLARQTAEATGEIKNRIEGIQASTEVTVSGIRKISEIITEIDSIVSATATSLAEQNETMMQLSTNIAQAGRGIGAVSENVAQSSSFSQNISSDISEVYSAVNEISNDSAVVKENADELRQLSVVLQDLIKKFKL